MFFNIHFYNHYGNGDIFISREFVKDICSKIPAVNYYYAHPKSERILADIPFLLWEPIRETHEMRRQFKVAEEDLYINTWLGVTSKYVTPANSCSILNSYRMYNDVLKAIGVSPLSFEPDYYIPRPAFHDEFGTPNFELAGVDDFVKNFTNNFILIDTCYVQSNQAENFNFTPIVDNLSLKFKDFNFVTTTRMDFNRDNVFYTGDITKTSDGFDLYEISYLSNYTNLIVGRSSGPAVFCMTRNNSLRKDITFLSFTYNKYSSHIVDWDWKIPAVRVWSNSTSVEKVTDDITKAMEITYGRDVIYRTS